MGKIVPRTAKDVVKILERFGFKFVSRGRHDKYRNEERGISVPVPVSHGVISRGVIQSLIRQTGIAREEFEV
ncbi:type II toxin-antitoxin system HicA family toxin [Candidatus Pacearchaeota archaeon]|nr:type II toxin-antitoxin system HicA family toxin [Candidatus Pacearchaeota archaeon]